MRSLALALSLVVSVASAAPVLVPYQGRLDHNGKPQSGSYDLQFTLSDASGAPLWQDTFSSVAVVQGAFSVKLGSGMALDGSVFNRSAIYVAIGVRGPGETTFTTLAGRQQVLATPYAAGAQQDFTIQGRLGVNAAPDGGAMVQVTVAPGAASGVRVTDSAGTLSAGGTSIGSSAALTVQPGAGSTTNVGGTLNVGAGLNVIGPITAPNAWTKIYDSGSDILLGTVDFQIHPNTVRSYLVYVDGYNSAATSGDSHLMLRFNSIQTASYRSFLNWYGETGGSFFENTGVAIAFNPESSVVFYNSQAVISSRGGGPYGFTVNANSSEIVTGNGHVFYTHSGGGLVTSCPDPCTVSVQASVGNNWLAHVVVYAVPN
jgi:hypothetical protein